MKIIALILVAYAIVGWNDARADHQQQLTQEVQ